MALLHKITIARLGFAGELSADAYWRVGTVAGRKGTMSAALEAFVDGEIVETVHVSFRPDISEGAPNVIAQAYGAAKALPQFEGAADA